MKSSSSHYMSQYNNAEKVITEPWPKDATLYQPYEAEQILLPENASCLAVKAYLKMCQLPFEVKSCANAEFMSPGGRVTKLPFVRAGAFVIAEFEPIVNFVEHKGNGLGSWMDEDEKANMRTYVSMTENIFTMAEIYMSFVVKQVYHEVTVPRISCVFPWPLSSLQNYIKRKNALRLLKVYQWHKMTVDDVIENVEKCCENLTLKLEESDTQYFYSDKPCELDAIVFGHLYSILTTRLPNTELATVVKNYKRLLEFCRFIDEEYFKSKNFKSNQTVE